MLLCKHGDGIGSDRRCNRVSLRIRVQASDPIPVSFRKRPSGIDRYRMSKGLKVRGWQLGDGVYFGQAKVGKKWGVGVIVDRGQYVYGINNRGIQLLRRL